MPKCDGYEQLEPGHHLSSGSGSLSTASN
jgi:hypothetical protein